MDDPMDCVSQAFLGVSWYPYYEPPSDLKEQIFLWAEGGTIAAFPEERGSARSGVHALVHYAS
jgi:hypothetical protein